MSLCVIIVCLDLLTTMFVLCHRIAKNAKTQTNMVLVFFVKEKPDEEKTCPYFKYFYLRG